MSLEQIEALLAGISEAHGIAIGLKPLLQGAGHLLLVLDHKDVHVPFIGRGSASLASYGFLIFS